MLDQQRQRSSAQQQSHANYTRVILFAHLAVGCVAAGLLVFHELFFASLMVVLWYLHSLGLIVGMCRMLQWCRITLGLWFILAGLAAIFFVTWMPPATTAASVEPALSVQLIPIWLSSVALGYIAAGATILLSRRVERATAYGFALWQPTNPW